MIINNLICFICSEIVAFMAWKLIYLVLYCAEKYFIKY
jgi:hypothetical protein